MSDKKLIGSLPIVPVKRCSCLANAKAGQLKPSLLRPIEKGGRLHQCAADAYEAMDAAANAAGIDLSPTSPADTYRSLEMQETAFFQRYTTTPKNKELKKQKPRIYQGKAWYLKKGMAPLAVPGTSNHNWGIAVDIANASGKRLEWLAANAPLYGFSWEVLPQEPWHIRYVVGDAVPEAVKAWKKAQA